MKLNLFTGKIGYILSDKGMSFSALMIMLIFNFWGIGITIWLYSAANPGFVSIISMAAAAKFSNNILALFINACFCGALIHFAVINKQTILTVFAIMIFILIGAEHCVADFPYFIYNLSWMNLLKLISIILGNSVGAFLIERLVKQNNEIAICRINNK